MTTILEVNDAELTLFRGREIQLRSPGIAVLLEDTTYFGEAALRLSRTHPRQTNAQYFTRLSADALPFATRQVRNHADLVYLHLRELAPMFDGEILLAVPALLTAEQLGVLLGILQELDIRVRGFVDTAVAAAASGVIDDTAVNGSVCHIDVAMQRAVVTNLTIDQEVRRTGCQEVTECGLARLLESWVNVAADRFIQETRYDPLHAAASEQQLFDQLCDWIEADPQPAERALEIAHGDQTRRVDLSRSLLEQKAALRFQHLLEAVPEQVPMILSARAARLPGIRRFLSAQRELLAVLPDQAPAEGCLANLTEIVRSDSDLRLVTRLPRGVAGAVPAAAAAAAPPAGAAPPAQPPQPTHALLGSRAISLRSEFLPIPVRFGSDAPLLLADDGLTLNGTGLSQDTPLKSGDRVGRGADEYIIIHVEH